MRISDFPLMSIFIAHAFEANSCGGHLVGITDIIGTQEEWQKADDWWREFTEGMKEEEIRTFIAAMGMKADEGFTMYQDFEGRIEQGISPPWVLLDRYY